MRSVHEDRYSIFWHDQERKFVCFYCGHAASTLDHQPPLSRVSDYQSLRLIHEMYVKVPCCQECNSLLGAALTADLIEREQLVKAMLEERYRRFIDVRQWTDGEIRQRGIYGRLRQSVEGFKRKQEDTLRRLDYAGGINAWLTRLELGGWMVESMTTREDE